MDNSVKSVEIRAPGPPPAGHMPILNFWTVVVVLQNNRMEQWEVVLPYSEVLDALKTLTITESAILIAHLAFARESNETQGTEQGTTGEPGV